MSSKETEMGEPLHENSAPHPTDIHVGKRLRIQRILLGLSQDKLAKAVGLTFQQVQKYERGINRVSASRLYEFSKVLGVPVSYFFEGAEEVEQLEGLAEDSLDFIAADGENREILDLVRVYKSIQNPVIRRQVLTLVRLVASSADPEAAKKSAE